MPLFFAILSAAIALIAWMYLLTRIMRTGAGPDFIRRARLNVLRGILIAAVLLFVSMLPHLQDMIYHDWFILPCFFYLLALPYLWRKIRWISLLPIVIGVTLTFLPDSSRSLLAIFW